MIAREAWYHERCMTKFKNIFREFSNGQENHVKDIQKSLEVIAVAKCMLFVEDSLQNSNEVAPFIKLSFILKFYCNCLENLKAPVASVNVTRLKEKTLLVISKLPYYKFLKSVMLKTFNKTYTKACSSIKKRLQHRCFPDVNINFIGNLLLGFGRY